MRQDVKETLLAELRTFFSEKESQLTEKLDEVASQKVVALSKPLEENLKGRLEATVAKHEARIQEVGNDERRLLSQHFAQQRAVQTKELEKHKRSIKKLETATARDHTARVKELEEKGNEADEKITRVSRMVSAAEATLAKVSQVADSTISSITKLQAGLVSSTFPLLENKVTKMVKSLVCELVPKALKKSSLQEVPVDSRAAIVTKKQSTGISSKQTTSPTVSAPPLVETPLSHDSRGERTSIGSKLSEAETTAVANSPDTTPVAVASKNSATKSSKRSAAASSTLHLSKANSKRLKKPVTQRLAVIDMNSFSQTPTLDDNLLQSPIATSKSFVTPHKGELRSPVRKTYKEASCPPPVPRNKKRKPRDPPSKSRYKKRSRSRREPTNLLEYDFKFLS